jgi:ribose transport system substrate-binding protein
MGSFVRLCDYCRSYDNLKGTARLRRKHIHFVGIDDDPLVLDAIRNGQIDATISQNPYGHGYITCTLLKYLLDGWKPKEDVYFVNAGIAIVTKENVDTYFDDILDVTQEILDSLEERNI